jgi:hypothetical protein
MTEDARESETERGFRAETQGRGGRKETGERNVAEFFTTEQRRAQRRRRAERSGILKKFRGRCACGLEFWRKGFLGFWGPRMTEDAREWETEQGFRAETQGRGGRKETGERKVAEF